MWFVKSKTEFFSILTITCSLLTIIFSIQTINFTKLRLEKQRAEGAEISLLPDYRHEAKKHFLRKCDNGATRIMKWDGPDYYVTEATLASGNSYIMAFWTRADFGAHFWMKSSKSDPVELTQDMYWQKIAEEKTSPNYIKHVLGGGTNDCYKAKIYSDVDQEDDN